MIPHFENMLAKRELDAERHARCFSARLTKYEFEDVQTAALALWDAHDDYLRAYAAFSEAIDANTSPKDRRYPAWERFATPPVQKLMQAHTDIYSDAPNLGGVVLGRGIGGNEPYPLTRWAKKAAAYRKAAKAFRKALAIFAEEMRHSEPDEYDGSLDGVYSTLPPDVAAREHERDG